MSDFDFDELDKAVNGVLATPAVDPDTSGTQDVALKEETPLTTTPSDLTSTDASASSTIAPAARRSGGRFMDMVHPSSDMRTRQNPAVVAPLETPFADHVAPSVSNDTPAVDAPQTDALQLDTSDWQTPLESPFLPDAKVEKRPLGGSEPTGDAAVASSNSDEDDKDEPLALDVHTMPDPLDFMASQQQEETPAPEEPVVSKDPEVTTSEEPAPLLLEETPTEETPLLPDTSEPSDSQNENTTTESSSDIIPPTAPPLVVEEKSESPDETESHIAALEEQPIGPTSITQQYQEQPSSTQGSGAIYDTEAYHQPLAHPAKKRSGWWIVLWIFLLIVFGAGAGAAFYIYVLPTLG